ncbi:hypothetical protein GW755_01325 [bacterium]|nr:hypothetical protein [bacterium]
MKRKRLNIIYIALLILVYLLHTSKSTYSSELKVGIKPTDSKSVNFEDILNPGESKSVPFRLVNLSEGDLSIKLELAGVKGSYEGQAQYDITQKYKILDYLKLPVDKFDLIKGEKTDINLLLSVPEGSDPGEYLGGILVKDADTGEVLGESKVNLLVNGDLERKVDATFSVIVENDKPTAKIKLTNLGNTKIEGIRIDYTLKNLKFKKFISSERTYLYTSPIIILPGDTQEINHPLDVNLDPIGNYEVNAQLSYGGLQPLTFTEGFNYTSKKKMAILGIVGSVIFVIFSLATFYFTRWFVIRRKQVKSINKKWENVVSNLIEGEYVGNSTNSISRIHQEDLDFIISSIKQEVRNTFRDEISTLNFSGEYSSKRHSKKKKAAKISSSIQHITSIV